MHPLQFAWPSVRCKPSSSWTHDICDQSHSFPSKGTQAPTSFRPKHHGARVRGPVRSHCLDSGAESSAHRVSFEHRMLQHELSSATFCERATTTGPLGLAHPMMGISEIQSRKPQLRLCTWRSQTIPLGSRHIDKNRSLRFAS